MSLYNMLMGRNPFSPYLLAAIGITSETAEQYPLGRIRDVYTNAEATKVFILHRNYGEAGLPFDDAMAKNPNYVQKLLADQRTGKETTFWLYEFNVPAIGKDIAKEVAQNSDTIPAFDRYQMAIEDMAAGKENPQTEHMMAVGKKIFEPLMRSLDSDEPTHEHVEVGDGSVDIFSPGASNGGNDQGPGSGERVWEARQIDNNVHDKDSSEDGN